MSGAASLRAVTTLRKRHDFLLAARALHVSKPGFVLQMRRHAAENASGMRVGFTCSKKVGNAVQRNRAKRRLREIARAVLPHKGLADTDYVLIGRRDKTASLPFDRLKADLESAIDNLHGRLK
ncbi:ribonuclease P protein component [uncultured Roseobacter sp.]|uniref:ribonuclease P protein component n=1 Tax=uncultured Roseobacter sp. TaxID=114847 RepID=UPI002620A0F7|nr:ribonuclease P protein component [uncultured Roseobacter sp.]